MLSGVKAEPLSSDLMMKRLDREHRARLEAELIAERATRELYDKQRALVLLQGIATAANEAATVEEAMQSALSQTCVYAGWLGGHVYFRGRNLNTEPIAGGIEYFLHPQRFRSVRRLTESAALALDGGLPARVFVSGKAAWSDIDQTDDLRLTANAGDAGIAAFLAFPVLIGSEVAAVLEFFSDKGIEPDQTLLALLASVGAQLGRVIERQRDRDVLQRTEVYYRHLTENALEFITILNSDGTIRYESPYVEQILGYRREEYLGKNAFDFVHPDDLPTVLREFGDCLHRPGNTPTLSFRFRHKAGTWRMLEGFGNNLLDDRSVAGIIFSSRDVTEQQRANDRMRALHEINLSVTSTLDLRALLSLLLQKIDTLMTYPVCSTVRLFNPDTGQLEHIACRNLDEEEWKNQQWEDQCGLPKMVVDQKSRCLLRDIAEEIDTPRAKLLQARGLVSYLGVPLMVKGAVLGVVGFYLKRDQQFSNEEIEFLDTVAGETAIAIHNSQLYEQTRNQAAELLRANNVKSEFLNVMSHELKTPINIIMGNAQLLSERHLGEVNTDQEKSLGKITERSKELLSMIEGVLEASKILAGEIKLENRSVLLNDFIDALKLDYDNNLQKEIALVWQCPAGLPHMIIDSGRLKLILKNLVDNAIKFTDRGNVTVAVRHLSEENKVQFTVADTGIGIAEEDRSIIFDIFRQLDSSSTRAYEGIGMGLYFVKAYAELLRGTVEVESEVDKGSIFTVTIPNNNRNLRYA